MPAPWSRRRPPSIVAHAYAPNDNPRHQSRPAATSRGTDGSSPSVFCQRVDDRVDEERERDDDEDADRDVPDVLAVHDLRASTT